ncbi:hypothetical protein G7043_28465 [Lentzea sp. NEAU-D13]|uniref:Uncharacterized protein n=1 Tax=Lentzea alba TaxID=2714351 RepID=A0A7C9W3V9_9PSEU|nr:hypothetical protein [Lentzea alba]NGY62859.1 hypothetical protein [Lentzea alba]
MTIPEATTMRELIDDCAQLPFALTHPEHPLPSPRAAAPWQVDDRCTHQVEGLAEYGV